MAASNQHILDAWCWPIRPATPEEFDAMMTSLDRHLAENDLIPAHRALHAARLVSMALHLDGIPFLGANIVRGDPFSPTDLLPRTLDWYTTQYGERNKLNLSLGAVVLELHGTFWRLRIPNIYGTVRVFTSRDLSVGNLTNTVSARPPHLNLLTLISDLTPDYAARLSDDDLVHVERTFQTGYNAIGFLGELVGSALFDQARHDYHQSVDTLLGGRALSKTRWDTAQAAEKVFKGLLDRAGQHYPTNARDGHDIVGLGKLIQEHLPVSLPEASLRTIHCSPAVRYGEMQVSIKDAYAAHVELINVLALFSRSMSAST